MALADADDGALAIKSVWKVAVNHKSELTF